MKSILSDAKECYFCKSTMNLHKHHIFFGTANRKKSEEFGCWVYLCAGHHNMTDYSVHFNKELDLKLKKECQKEFEKYGSREDFRRIFGKSYL